MQDIQTLYREFHRKVVEVEPPCVTQPESFYPEDFYGGGKIDPAVRLGGTAKMAIEVAKRLCSECPIQAACLEYAVEAGEEWGIWGGLSSRER